MTTLFLVLKQRHRLFPTRLNAKLNRLGIPIISHRVPDMPTESKVGLVEKVHSDSEAIRRLVSPLLEELDTVSVGIRVHDVAFALPVPLLFWDKANL